MTVLAQTSVFAWALQWGKYGSGTIAAQKATARLDFTGQPADGKLLVVGAKTYTYKTTLTPAANEIKIGTTVLITVSNTVAAIQAGAGAGTAYGTGTTANTDADAVSAYQTIFLTADVAGKAGNALALSTDASQITIAQGWQFGYDAGTFDLTTLAYSRHRATDINYDAAQDGRPFPLELGGTIFPTGYYKAGTAVGGGATVMPRLQRYFGELFLALLGKDTVTQNSPVAGAHTHKFSVDPAALERIPWVAVRRHAPGRDVNRPVGLTGVDNLLASMRLMIPQNDILQARVDFVGRIPKFDPYSDAWLYQNTYENSDKAAFSCVGYFKIPTIFTNALPVTSVVVEFINNITTPQQEMIIGSYFPDDYVVRSRLMRVRFVYKWHDPELYERVYTNTAAGTDWSPVPFTTNYSAGNHAFEAHVESTQSVITGTTPYQLTIRAGSMAFEPVGPLALQAGGILSQEYMGLALEPDPGLGVDYANVLLINGYDTAYVAPTQP